MNVLVCGSRGWTDTLKISLRLAQLPAASTIVYGGANGADNLAADIARTYGHSTRCHPADWKQHGKRAGIIRNLDMLNSGPELVIAFWDGESKGTAHTISEARRRGIPVEVIR